MTVTVRWPTTKARGNRRHEFRPTGDNRLRAGERSLGSAIVAAFELIPRDLVEDIVLGRTANVDAAERLTEAMSPALDSMQRAVYGAYVAEQAEMTGRIRDAVNGRLRRLGSDVRLAAPGDVAKATIKLRWTVDLPNFDAVNPAAPASVYARSRASAVLSRIAIDEQRVILEQVGRAFTETQVFTTGRTVIGRTVEQTARSVVPMLASLTPGRMDLTPADLALYRTRYTNGLFPRWATAVNNFADAQARRLAQAGITGRAAKDIIDSRTAKYGERLRRSRARMIARTEISIAQNEAIVATMRDARNRGLVGSNTMKEWVTGPFDVCPICTALSGTRVRMTESFPNVGEAPPAHPSCRCVTRMVPDIGSAPVRIGQGTPDDPFRYRFPDGWEAPITPVRAA